MSKHASYFRNPTRNSVSEVKLYKGIKNQPGDSLFETPRSEYINSNVDYSGKRVLDIGCNTGFFLFNALEQGAVRLEGYEGSKEACDILNKYKIDKNPIKINNKYFNFKDNSKVYDVIHCLNVVHHFGDDYGDQKISIDDAKKEMLKQVDFLAGISKNLVFQMGFNWKGDTKYPLFNKGQKSEVIEFLNSGLEEWRIVNVGIAELIDDVVVYKDCNDSNIARQDSMGEFLNRPIFVMESKRF